jgi:hypothetical protein
MKPFYICLLLLLAGNALCREEMTPKRFRELVATAGDTNALRPELASLPIWRSSKCSIIMKYQDGKVFKEDCNQTAKTIGGKYIVFSTDSQYYKQTMHSMAGYDDKASAVRLWGLYGDIITEATMVFDPERKLSASTSRYGDGFMESSVGSCSATEMSEHTLVYKDGILVMTRDVTTRPSAPARKGERNGAANRSPPARPETNRTSAAAGPVR